MLPTPAVFPILYNKPAAEFNAELDSKVNFAVEYGKENGFINRGDFIVVVNGWKQGSGFTNTMRIVTAS
ncbi:hypothetical protein RB195_007375 [Necator americanus]|uniref:Pyruvate kinase C-terminal domain-containing protein n=1 Tax=Necator americanus TaxID=51031 RepID=A0ABR1BY78_NECAM